QCRKPVGHLVLSRIFRGNVGRIGKFPPAKCLTEPCASPAGFLLQGAVNRRRVMKPKPEADKTKRTNMNLGQKEAAMEKLGKDKTDHMGYGKKLPPRDKSKPAANDPMRH